MQPKGRNQMSSLVSTSSFRSLLKCKSFSSTPHTHPRPHHHHPICFSLTESIYYVLNPHPHQSSINFNQSPLLISTYHASLSLTHTHTHTLDLSCKNISASYWVPLWFPLIRLFLFRLFEAIFISSCTWKESKSYGITWNYKIMQRHQLRYEQHVTMILK